MPDAFDMSTREPQQTMQKPTIQTDITSGKEISRIANEAQEILITADNIFPFVLFPGTITVDRVKVTITNRKFFQVAEVISTQIEDVLNVESDTGPFFGSINLYTRFFVQQPLRIEFLSRQKAIELKNLLQGYIIARHQSTCIFKPGF